MEQEISKEVIYLIGSSIIGTVSLITVTITSLVTFKVSNKNNLALGLVDQMQLSNKFT